MEQTDISKVIAGGVLVEGMRIELRVDKKLNDDAVLENFEDQKCDSYTFTARLETKGRGEFDTQELQRAAIRKLTEAIDETGAQ